MRSLKTIQLEIEKDRFMDHRSKLVVRREQLVYSYEIS